MKDRAGRKARRSPLDVPYLGIDIEIAGPEYDDAKFPQTNLARLKDTTK